MHLNPGYKHQHNKSTTVLSIFTQTLLAILSSILFLFCEHRCIFCLYYRALVLKWLQQSLPQTNIAVRLQYVEFDVLRKK